MKTSSIIAGSSLALSFTLLMLALTVTTGAFGGGFGSAFSEKQREQMHAAHESITREVTEIDNGVVVTVTSTDPEVVAKLQSLELKGSLFENVTRTRENIENGVRVTITSDDPETVEMIQNAPHSLRGILRDPELRAKLKEARESITREVTEIDNGIVVTVTSTDPEVVAKLQSLELKGSLFENVTRTRENIENGVRVTITSDDPETVEMIQNGTERLGHVLDNAGNGYYRQKARAIRESIEAKTTEIANGIVIEITSDDDRTVEMLQSKEPRGPYLEGIDRTHENIENGIRVTITSDDPETAEKIQLLSEQIESRIANGAGHHGHRKGFGRWR